MAQIATTKSVAEVAQATAGRSAGTAPAIVWPGTKPMLRLVEPTAALAKREPVSFWLELAGEQMIQSVEVMGKLATSRHWPEALAIQQGFAQASYARMTRWMSCHLGWPASVMLKASQSMPNRKAPLLTVARISTD